MFFNPFVEEITKLIQKAKDWFGNPEDFQLPIQKRRVLIFVANGMPLLAILLTPIIFIYGKFFPNQRELASIFLLLLGVVYMGIAVVINKIGSKDKDRIKVRAWLAGEGKWWKGG